MNVFLFYLIALLVTCAYLALHGGRTGRWLAAIQIVMAVATAIASYFSADFVELQPRLLALDTLSLLLKLTVALQSTRRWPMWIAAFQLNSVLAQAAVYLSPAFRDEFFYAMTTIWSVPTLFVMAAGLALDRRRMRTHAA